MSQQPLQLSLPWKVIGLSTRNNLGATSQPFEENLGLHQAANTRENPCDSAIFCWISHSSLDFDAPQTLYPGIAMFSRSSHIIIRSPHSPLSSLIWRSAFSIFPQACRKQQDFQARYRHLVQKPEPDINHGPSQPRRSSSPSPSTKLKWVRLSALTATLSAAGWGIMWFVCRDEVPIIERSRANLYSRDWVVRHEASFNPQVERLYQLLKESESNPDLLWPDDHVATVAVRRVFNKLIAASGLDPSHWAIRIVTAPGELGNLDSRG